MTHAHHHADHDHASHDHHHDDGMAHVHLPQAHAVMPLTPLVMSASVRLSFVAVIVALMWALYFWAIR